MRCLNRNTQEGVLLECTDEVMTALVSLDQVCMEAPIDEPSGEEVLVSHILRTVNSKGLTDDIMMTYGPSTGAIVLRALTGFARGPKEDPVMRYAGYMLQLYYGSLGVN